jgi:hypothetical protein
MADPDAKTIGHGFHGTPDASQLKAATSVAAFFNSPNNYFWMNSDTFVFASVSMARIFTPPSITTKLKLEVVKPGAMTAAVPVQSELTA